MNQENEDFLDDKPTLKIEDVTPRDLLTFSKVILIVLAIMWIAGGLSEILRPNNNLFEACKVTLPPIATLIIGYYFGKSKN